MKIIAALILTLGLVGVAHAQVPTPTQRVGSAVVTIYRYVNGMPVYEADTSIEIITTRNGHVISRQTYYPASSPTGGGYQYRYITVIDRDPSQTDTIFYAVNAEGMDDVSIYVEYFTVDGRSIYTDARTIHPGNFMISSAMKRSCPEFNPFATGVPPCS